MSDITPEMLKVIAEGMFITHGKVRTNNWTTSRTILANYNPLTNAELCMEIMEKLKILVMFDDPEHEYPWLASVLPYGEEGEEGKTLPKAVCKAAYKYFIKELGQ